MDEDSAKVLRAYAGLKLRKSRKDGAYNVCKAWEDQYKYGQEKGRQEERTWRCGCLILATALRKSVL